MAFLNENKDDEYYITTWKHKKPLNDILKSCSVQEFETILELSAEALKYLRDSSKSLQFQEILKEKIKEVEQQKIKEQEMLYQQYENQKRYEELSFKNKVQDLEIKLEQTVKNYESKYKQKEYEFNTLLNTNKNLELNLREIKQSYQILDNNFHQLQKKSQDTFNESLDNVALQFELQHSKVENILREQIKKLELQLEVQNKNSISQSVSSNKGKTGEQNFDLMVERFTTWSLKDTSKSPQSCDRFGEIRGCKALFEIKNYSYNIPKKEVDKFKRDLETHKDCPLGVFISLNTNIIGAPQDFFYTEFTNSNQLLIYIQQFNNHDIESLFTVIDGLVDIASLLYNKCSINNNSTNLQSKIDSIKPILQNEINEISNATKDLNTSTKFILETIQKQHILLKNRLEKIQYSFKSILQILFEDILVVETSNDEKAEPPKKRNRKKPSSNQTVINFEPVENNQSMIL